MRALSKEPGQRFPSVSAYAQALKAGLSERVGPPTLPPAVAPLPVPPVRATTPHWPTPDTAAKGPVKPVQRAGLGWVWLVALAAVVLMVAVIGVGAYLNNQNQRPLRPGDRDRAGA